MSALAIREWRRQGCGDGCYRDYVASLSGDGQREWRVYHDPDQHEAYGAAGAAMRSQDAIIAGPLVIDVARSSATLDGEPMILNPNEFALLTELARRAPKVCLHRELLRWVWGNEYANPACWSSSEEAHLLRVNISRVRAKLGQYRDLLVNVNSVGYRLDLQ